MGERNEGKDNSEAASRSLWNKTEVLGVAFREFLEVSTGCEAAVDKPGALQWAARHFGDRVVLRSADSMTFRLSF